MDPLEIGEKLTNCGDFLQKNPQYMENKLEI